MQNSIQISKTCSYLLFSYFIRELEVMGLGFIFEHLTGLKILRIVSISHRYFWKISQIYFINESNKMNDLILKWNSYYNSSHILISIFFYRILFYPLLISIKKWFSLILKLTKLYVSINNKPTHILKNRSQF